VDVDWNPEFKAMINNLIEEQENLFTNNEVLIQSQELKEYLNLHSVSDFLYGKLFGLVLGTATAHFKAFHGRMIGPEDIMAVEEITRIKCKKIKEFFDKSSFQ
jgi:hypothetical protein